MPKLPGRESTRIVFPIDDVLIASFSWQWDRWVKGKPCVIKGCTHRADVCTEGEAGGPSYVMREEDVRKERVRGGYACQCCTAKILGREQ